MQRRPYRASELEAVPYCDPRCADSGVSEINRLREIDMSCITLFVAMSIA